MLLPFVPIASRVHELTPFAVFFPGLSFVPLPPLPLPTLLIPPSVIAYHSLCLCRHSDTNHLFTYTRYYYCYSLTLFLFRLERHLIRWKHCWYTYPKDSFPPTCTMESHAASSLSCPKQALLPPRTRPRPDFRPGKLRSSSARHVCSSSSSWSLCSRATVVRDVACTRTKVETTMCAFTNGIMHQKIPVLPLVQQQQPVLVQLIHPAFPTARTNSTHTLPDHLRRG